MEVKDSTAFLLISVVLWICLIPRCYGATNGLPSFKCMQAERKALLRFKGSLADPDYSLSSWKGEDCCIWKGIGCDNTTGHVLKLDLQGNFVESNELDSALLDLKHLVYLDLSRNHFKCSIPEFVGSMERLEHLGLSWSGFNGLLPHQLGNLTRLRFLNLRGNKLLVDDLNFLTGLLNLQFFDMSSTNLGRVDNLIPVLNRLPSLSELHLKHCALDNRHLSGVQVNFTMRTTLQYLDLEANSFGINVPVVLQNFSSLRSLVLSDTRFYTYENCLGGSIPQWLAKFTSLEHLDLRWNRFSHVEGRISSFIISACKMKELYLSNNILSGELSELHSNSSTSISHHLEEHHLSSNELNDHIPTETIGQLSSLRVLLLDQNNLSGSIPSSIEQLSFLEEFDLSYNQISGGLPPFPSSLRVIRLSDNSISGSIPHFPSSLEYMDLSNNNINGSIPNFPSNVYHIDLSSNRITGGIPCIPSSLEEINLSRNKISGPIPHFQSQKSTISQLSILDLSDNSISGSMQQFSFHLMPFLRSLILANNNLDGSIPASLCILHYLDTVNLRQNRLSGMIPNCWNNSIYLLSVRLSSNKLSGSFPTSFLKNCPMLVLDLSKNFLRGEVPSFANCSELEVLDLGGNKLSGTIPSTATYSVSPLMMLRLRENDLEGPIPSALCSFSKLRIIDLADNNLTGSIPPCFWNFTFVSHPDPNVDSITEVFKGEAREYTSWKTFAFLANIDLSANSLVGAIPDELVKLADLLGLNLSGNHLMGSIPNKIGEMRSLESLDLSNNHLSGTIPQSMSALTSLSYLNLSYNNLQGQIPTGSQLQTLNDPSIYTGNQGLCGDPLPKKCKRGNNQPKLPHSATSAYEHEEVHEKLWFYLVIAVGFTTGFWGVVGTLVVKKSRRHAYFKFMEDLYSRIYVQAEITKNKLKESMANRKSDG